MYDELIKRLHRYSENYCAYKLDADFADAVQQAADVIEELSCDLNSMNEANTALYGALPKWIPVTARLPEFNENVLVYSAHTGLICIDANIQFDRNATHWMPLPEPPEGARA